MLGRSIYFVVRAIRAVTYRVFDALTTTYYRIVCKEFGKGSRVGCGSWLHQPRNISIGRNVRIGRRCLFGSESNFSTLNIFDSVSINDKVQLDFSGDVTIQQYAFISEQVVIYSHTHGLDPRGPPRLLKKEIGQFSWIGAHSIIMHGCQDLGANAIVGAGTIVVDSIPAEQVVVNASARLIKRKTSI